MKRKEIQDHKQNKMKLNKIERILMKNQFKK